MYHEFLVWLIPLILVITMIFIWIAMSRRYHTFTNREVVLRFRTGRLISNGLGGAYFVLPLVDTLISIPISRQRVVFHAKQDIVFKPKFAKEEVEKKINQVRIQGSLAYKIIDPAEFYSKSSAIDPNIQSNQQDNLIISTSAMIKDIVVNHLNKLILEKNLDELYKNRDELINQIGTVLQPFSEELKIEVSEINITNFVFQ